MDRLKKQKYNSLERQINFHDFVTGVKWVNMDVGHTNSFPMIYVEFIKTLTGINLISEKEDSVRNFDTLIFENFNDLEYS